MTDKDKPLRQRDRKQTENDIIAAVGRLLVQEGFSNLGINAIAREAGVDKVLIYRYFGGLDQLLQAFASHTGFWPTAAELFAGVDLASLPLEQRLSLFIDRTIDALRSRPLTLEILAMEIKQRNPLTDTLNHTLENWGRGIANHLADNYQGDVQRLNIIMTVIFAGIQYLILRARNTEIFSTINIQEDHGWQSIKQSLTWLCKQITQQPSSD